MSLLSLILIVAPLVFPIAIELGIDPIHLGIIIGQYGDWHDHSACGAQPFCDLWRCRHANDARRESGSAVFRCVFIFLIMVTYLPFLSTGCRQW